MCPDLDHSGGQVGKMRFGPICTLGRSTSDLSRTGWLKSVLGRSEPPEVVWIGMSMCESYDHVVGVFIDSGAHEKQGIGFPTSHLHVTVCCI